MRPSEVAASVAPGCTDPVHMMDVVFPNQTNHYGTLFGGQALALMDRAAFIAATRFARCVVVTASSQKTDFHTPVVQGQLVELVARVISTKRSSMVVEVELFGEALLSGARSLCTRGEFTMVALDGNGKPTRVPAFMSVAAPGVGGKGEADAS